MFLRKDAETKRPIANVKFAIYNVDQGEQPAKNSKGEIIGKREIIDGKEYYVIDGKLSGSQLMLQNVISTKAYIDRETGLTMKIIEITKENNNKKEYITNYEYNFDSITDDEISEPNTIGYEEN